MMNYSGPPDLVHPFSSRRSEMNRKAAPERSFS
jgi:hypothetical protein